ncbi:MAG: sugar phosphate isomerase/epimerase family protein [Leadbetterella sp.]
MKRRSILKIMGTSALTIPLTEAAHSNPTKSSNSKVKFYAPTWGSSHSIDAFCKKVKEAGYDGIESPVSLKTLEREELMQAVQKNGLELIAQYYQSFENDPKENVKNYEMHLKNMLLAKPVKINTQTGKDFFTFEQNKAHFEIAQKIQNESGIPIVHETHRGKALFAAHISKEYFEKIPNSRITLDISHWCNVHESLLNGLEKEVDLALSKADHIHSRIGHAEGPQVNDPRAPEWKTVLDKHLDWWDKIYKNHQKAGTTLTVTTEFGPSGYLPTLPYTQMPVASQWDINVFMLNLLKERWK